LKSLENSKQKERGILRSLQQFTLQIYPYQLEEIREWLEMPIEGTYVLKSSELYSEQTDLQCRSPQGEAFIL